MLAAAETIGRAVGARTCPSPRPSPHREERWGEGALDPLLMAGGNTAEALSLSAAALAAHETALGANHPQDPRTPRA